MANHSLIFANERRAAKLLDMKLAEYRALVDMGILPPPIDLAGHKRWRVSDLEAIASGQVLDEEFET